MADTGVLALIVYLLIVLPFGYPQDVDNTARNIFQALSSTIDCGQFQSLIVGAGRQTQEYFTYNQHITVFAPNNTAFEQMREDKRRALFDMTAAEKENYVKSYTLPKILETSSMSSDLVEESLGGPGVTKLFFHKKITRFSDIIVGIGGRTEYYMNGAYLFKPDIRAQNGIIHMIDRVLDPIISNKVYGYLRVKNSKFYTEVINYVDGRHQNEISELQTSQKMTLFVPTDAAITKIPDEKLRELQGDQKQLVRVILQHAIRGSAIYTSFMDHNEPEECMRGRVIFKKNVRELVYVSGGHVTAEINPGNLTLSNGVIQYVDSLLGYVYNTAREQIQIDPELRSFNDMVNRGRKELQDALVANVGVTVFAPMNDAFRRLEGLPNVNMYNNQTLINMVFEMQLMEPGTNFEITNINGDYKAREEKRTRFRGWTVKVYSQGNETWAEGGYVKAKVIRSDVGVTNGLVQYIDAVFGIPSRDLPGAIYCEDWLIKSSYVFSLVGFNQYLRDSRITNPLPPCSYDKKRVDFNYALPGLNQTNLQTSWNRVTDSSWLNQECGATNQYCEFTVFVPNGTTVDSFQQSYYGRELFGKPDKLHRVLSRHVIRGKKIYMDQINYGQHRFKTDNGDTIFITKVSDYYMEITFRNVRAVVLHGDLGATNGVFHIIDSLLFVSEDLTDSSSIPKIGLGIYILVLLSCLQLYMQH